MTRALVVAALTLILLPLNAAGQNWQQGFDFRATAGYVTDPPTATYVLSTTAYPTTRNGVTFGWANTALVQPRDRSMLVDPRLAGINYVNNGAPAKFYVDLPSAGTYNLSLALGDDGYPQCWTQCQVQFLDGNTVVGTVNGGFEGLGFFYDATGKNWSATVWPGSNAPLQVTMNGTRLTVLVGTSNNTGDITPIAFLGVSQTMSVPNFTVTANPTGVSVMQGSQGTSTINTTISGVFNSAITLSTSGVPTGTTVSFSPNPIGAPGSGSSTMTITVGSNTAMGTYPITVTGDGGGIERTTTVTLTVTSPVQPDFTIAVSPNSLLIGQGNQGTSTVTTTIVGGFNSAISLSATGVPTGTTVSFNPNPIAAPGNGSSTMTVMVGASTALGTYPITVTGTGGGTQHSATVTLTVTTAVWQQGFDFRATQGYVTDPPPATYVLSTTAYPTTRNGVSFGWANTALVQSRDRSVMIDPRLAGINYVNNGTPVKFFVDLPSAGTYNLSLAMGDDGYPECWTQCQVQFLDGNTVVGTVSGGFEGLGFFYDAVGKNWSATAWPGSNSPLQVTMNGTRLTVVVGSTNSTGDITTIAFLGITQSSAVPNFTIAANPSSLSVVQGNQGTSTIATTISGGFNSAISLSASGVPPGTTASFNPNPIAAPGSGSSTMTITVGSNTATGTYPIVVKGDGGGVEQQTTVMLTVTMAVQPDFTIAASPNTLLIGQGNQGTSTVTTTIAGGFNNAISLSATGVPTGTSVNFNPNPIAAPGNGSSTMTVMVGANTALGTYPITVTGTGGGTQHSITVTLTVTSAVWQQGFDFRATPGFITDPPTATYVLSSTAYPTTVNGITFGWANTAVVRSADRSAKTDPRLAGINYAYNGTPAKFYVNLPSAGNYNLSLAMGDGGYAQCWTQCEVQFLDGNTVVGTVSGGFEGLGFFYDATGKNWSAASWPGNNTQLTVSMTGSQLTVLVGTNASSGDLTPVGFLGVTQLSSIPSFTMSASPSSVSIPQGTVGTTTVTTTIDSGYNGAIALSASGVPDGTSITFNPATIPAPGAGSSTATITVSTATAVGIYPITITGTGGGVTEATTLTLTVTTGSQPDFRIGVSPESLIMAQGTQGNPGVYTSVLNGFNSAVNLSASGVPSGTTVTFNPNTIPPPGSGQSHMSVSVGSGTAPGYYPVTITGNGAGEQHSVILPLTVTSAIWQRGFDFRATAGYVNDPPNASAVLPSDLYPTSVQLGTFGWQNLASGSNRSTSIDPRLAGINFVSNGSQKTFTIDLPAPGTYNLSLAMGDAGFAQCAVLCQVQFLDNGRVLGTVSGSNGQAGFFFDAMGNSWSTAAWPTKNVSLPVTLTGDQLTVAVGTNQRTGDLTPIAYIGLQQVTTGPTFALQSPTAITVGQGQNASTSVSTVLIGSFNSAINLSSSGAPGGTTIAFNPSTIPAPGTGTALVTISVPAQVAIGTYPIMFTASGGGIVQNTPVTLVVTAPGNPDFALTAPAGAGIAPGAHASATVQTNITDNFNASLSLSATGGPSGTTITFNPTTIPAPGSGASTMTVTVPSNAAKGSYPIVVNALGGGKNHSATSILTVSTNGNVNLPTGTGWMTLGPGSVFCNVSPGTAYFNPQVGDFDSLDFLSLCQIGSMVAYSGAAVDQVNDRFFLWTSGHNNYQGNEMYELDLTGTMPMVSRITDPAWSVDNEDVPADCACKGTNNCGKGMWHDGAQNSVGAPYSESGFSGPTFESLPAPDGSFNQPSCGYGTAFQPNSRETYAGIVYHSATNKLFSWGGAVAADPDRFGYSNWSLDLNQKPPKWTRLKDSSYVWITAAVYDYTTNHPTSGYDLVFDENSTLYAYSAATDIYVTLASSLPLIGNNVNVQLDPIRHTLVMENGDFYGGYHLRIINLDSCNGTTCTVTNLDNEVSCAGTLSYWDGIAWDSKRTVMTLFPSSTNCTGSGCVGPFNTAYLLNTDPVNPITITYQGSQHSIPPQKCFAASYGSTEGVDYPPVSVGPGVYSRFAYFPNEDVYLFIQHPNSPVWVLRLE